MCVVSMVTGQGQTWWPHPNKWIPYGDPPGSPKIIEPIVVTKERQPTPEEWERFLELVRKAEEYDRLTGQPDCTDPAKDAWFDEAKERMAYIQQCIAELTAELEDLSDAAHDLEMDILDHEEERERSFYTHDIRDDYEMGN